MTVTADHKMRLSTIRDCPRRAVAEAIGAPHREPSDREKRIMWSGRRIGQDYLDMWQEAHPREELIREKKVLHQFGVGHEDGFIVSTGTVIEILSSAHASNDMIHSKLLQLTLYMAHDDDAKSGVLLVVDPRDYSDERVIVTKDSDRYETLLVEAMGRMEQVRDWDKTRRLPDRVCKKPADAIGHFCRCASWCFENWTPAPLEALNDAETHEFVARLYHAKQKEREVKQTLGIVEAERKEIEQRLDSLVDPGKFQVGGFQIVKSPRTRESFKLTLAKKDSRLPAALLDEFTTVSSFTVWSVDRAGAGDVDNGEVPF